MNDIDLEQVASPFMQVKHLTMMANKYLQIRYPCIDWLFRWCMI